MSDWEQCRFEYQTYLKNVDTEDECKNVLSEYTKQSNEEKKEPPIKPTWNSDKKQCDVTLEFCKFNAPEGNNLHQLIYAPLQNNKYRKVSLMCDHVTTKCEEMKKDEKTPFLSVPDFRTCNMTYPKSLNSNGSTNPVVKEVDKTAKKCSVQILDGMGFRTAEPYTQDEECVTKKK